jgi:hypothetical protein
LTLPPGLKNSSFATTSPGIFLAYLASLISGVRPTSSQRSAAMRSTGSGVSFFFVFAILNSEVFQSNLFFESSNSLIWGTIAIKSMFQVIENVPVNSYSHKEFYKIVKASNLHV